MKIAELLEARLGAGQNIGYSGRIDRPNIIAPNFKWPSDAPIHLKEWQSHLQKIVQALSSMGFQNTPANELARYYPKRIKDPYTIDMYYKRGNSGLRFLLTTDATDPDLYYHKQLGMFGADAHYELMPWTTQNGGSWGYSGPPKRISTKDGSIDVLMKRIAKLIKYAKLKYDISSYFRPKNAQQPVTEKWSAKYKRSIDCSNPKGFSQRAHCAGKKKQ